MDKSLQEFGQEIAHLMPRFIRVVLGRQFKAVKSQDITISQMVILTLLSEKKQCKMTEIAKALSITTSAATGLVDRMVRSHHLKRMPDEKDRRVINIVMTEKGKSTIDHINKWRYRMMMDMFGRLKPIERTRYLETVKKLYRIMTEAKR